MKIHHSFFSLPRPTYNKNNNDLAPIRLERYFLKTATLKAATPSKVKTDREKKSGNHLLKVFVFS